MAERNVTFLIIAKDFASRVLKDVGDSSDHAAQKLRDLNTMGLGPLATTAAALGPALLPVLAGVTAGAVGLGTSMLGAGAAVGVFGAVAKSVFGQVQEASQKSEKLREKIHLLTTEIAVADKMGDSGNAKKFAAARTKAVIEYTARLQQLPAPLRAAVLGMDRMRNAWEDFVTANRNPVLNLLARGMNVLAAVLPKLQPLFNVAASAAGRLMSAVEGLVRGGGFDDLVSWLTARAGPALEHFGSIAVNLGVGVAALLSPFAKTADGVVAGLDRMSGSFEHWAATSGQAGVEKILGFARTQGPGAARALQTIAVSFVKIVQATAPLAPISTAIAKALAQIVNALPQPVLTALIAGFIAWNAGLQVARVGTLAWSAGAKIAAAATWLFNSALLASPLTWIVIGLAALVVGLVLAYRHSATFRAIVQGALHAVVAAGKAVLAFFRGLPAFFSGMWNAVKGAFTTATAWIGQKLAAVGGFFKRLPGMILHELIAFPGQYLGFWKFLLEKYAFIVGFALGLVVNFFRHLPGWIMAGVRALPGLLSALWHAVEVKAVQTAKALVNGVVGFFRSLPGRAAGASRSLWSAVSGAFTSAYHGAVMWSKNAVDGAVRFFRSLPGKARSAVSGLPGQIKGAMSGAATWLLQAGEDVVRGLISGIRNMAGSVVQEAKNVAGQVVAGFKSAMHIGSPSQVMANEVGRWIPAGIAVGITRGMPVLAGAAAAVRSKLLGALDPRTRIRWGEVSAAKWDQLLASGWRGDPNDKMEALYAPSAAPETLQPIQLVVDGKVLQEVLLKVKRTNRGLALGLA